MQSHWDARPQRLVGERWLPGKVEKNSKKLNHYYFNNHGKTLLLRKKAFKREVSETRGSNEKQLISDYTPKTNIFVCAKRDDVHVQISSSDNIFIDSSGTLRILNSRPVRTTLSFWRTSEELKFS